MALDPRAGTIKVTVPVTQADLQVVQDGVQVLSEPHLSPGPALRKAHTTGDMLGVQLADLFLSDGH